MEADGAGQRVTRLALVQFDRGLTAKGGVLQPVEGEQRAFDPTDLPQRESEAVLTGIGAEAVSGDTTNWPSGDMRN